MYVVLEDGWKLRRTEQEVFTPDGWRKVSDLRIGDKVKNAWGKFMKVVEFT